MAKYQKGGKTVAVKHTLEHDVNHRITHPAHRDHRRYSEVLVGKLNKATAMEREAEFDKTVQVPLKVYENPVMVNKLYLAVVVELEPSTNVKQPVSSLTGTDVPFVCTSSLSPSKIVLFYENELSLKSAIEGTSPLRELFADVRRWSEEERYIERLAWLDRVAMHPKCWSFENFRRIGKIWGKTLQVEHEYNGVNSLTSAKILVRTTTKKRIETCVKIEWESGSCDVWVNEFQECECMVELTAAGSLHREPTKTFELNDNGVLDKVVNPRNGLSIQMIGGDAQGIVPTKKWMCRR